jgi:hypothetical protein
MPTGWYAAGPAYCLAWCLQVLNRTIGLWKRPINLVVFLLNVLIVMMLKHWNIYSKRCPCCTAKICFSVGQSLTKALSRHTNVMILHWSSCIWNSFQQTAFLHSSSCEGPYRSENSHSPPTRNQEGQLSCLAHCATQPRETTPPPPVCDQESLLTAWISRSPHFLRFSPIALLHERCPSLWGVSISCKHILNQFIPLITHHIILIFATYLIPFASS